MSAPIAAGNRVLQAVWMRGDFGAFSAFTQAGDDKVFRQAGIEPGEYVLDAACGAGGFAVRAAQAGARVIGIDIASNLIAQAVERARAANLPIQFDEGDVEELPYDEATFDTVVSQFGIMFAPRPERVVAELARVLKPGGRVVLFNWTPTSWVSQLVQVVSRHVPPPPNSPLPAQWGVEAVAIERLSPRFVPVSTTHDTYPMRFPFDPTTTRDFFLRNMGPVSWAYSLLREPEKAQALSSALDRFFQETNQGQPNAWQVDSEYLRIEARKD